jgi:hypothetical protein
MLGLIMTGNGPSPAGMVMVRPQRSLLLRSKFEPQGARDLAVGIRFVEHDNVRELRLRRKRPDIVFLFEGKDLGAPRLPSSAFFTDRPLRKRSGPAAR